MKNLLVIILLILTSSVKSQTPKEKEMVNLINQVRTNPKSFIPLVEERLKNEEFLLKLSSPEYNASSDFKVTINRKTTANGINVTDKIIQEIKDLIFYLETVEPVKPLIISSVIYPITTKHVNYLNLIKQTQHEGPNGQTFKDRVKDLNLIIGENCAKSNTATSAMIDFLLDVGIPTKDKGHRLNIMNPIFNKVSVGNINEFWVQNFSN